METNIQQAYRDLISKPIYEQQDTVLQNITHHYGGEVNELPCGGTPPLSQQKLAEIFKASVKECDDYVEIDLSKARIKTSEYTDEGTISLAKYRITAMNIYLANNGKAYNMVTSAPCSPIKLRAGRHDPESDREILVGKIELGEEKPIYFEPDLLVALCLIERRSEEHKDAVYLIVYDRSQGTCARCGMVALPDCTAAYDMVEVIKMMSKVLCAKERGELGNADN